MKPNTNLEAPERPGRDRETLLGTLAEPGEFPGTEAPEAVGIDSGATLGTQQLRCTLCEGTSAETTISRDVHVFLEPLIHEIRAEPTNVARGSVCGGYEAVIEGAFFDPETAVVEVGVASGGATGSVPFFDQIHEITPELIRGRVASHVCWGEGRFPVTVTQDGEDCDGNAPAAEVAAIRVAAGLRRRDRLGHEGLEALLGRFHHFRQGMCVVHHMFGAEVVEQVDVDDFSDAPPARWFCRRQFPPLLSSCVSEKKGFAGGGGVAVAELLGHCAPGILPAREGELG